MCLHQMLLNKETARLEVLEVYMFKRMKLSGRDERPKMESK